tara:strand:+ start:1036 stop:1236 length:201 start_codon:yes stop_codon:yes gene_type:complete
MTATIYQFPTGKTLDQIAYEYQAPASIMFKDWNTKEWVIMSIEDFKAGKHTEHRSILNLGKEDDKR